MEINKATILTVGTAIASVLAALSAHGKAAVEAVAGVPVLLQAWASGLPLGIWSFVLALTLSTLVWAVALRKLQNPERARAPHVSADTIALCTALVVCVAQQWSAAGKPEAGPLLNALFIGLLAGLLAPYLGRMARAVWGPKQ